MVALSSLPDIAAEDFVWVNFDLSYALVANHTYALVMQAPDGDASNMGWYLCNSSGTYTGGMVCHSYDGGSNWDSDSSYDALFQELGNAGSDIIPPASVTDLTTSSPTSNSITLTWTAPGDDGSTGTASQYDIRYSTAVITDNNWDSASQVTGEPAPQIAGTNQSFTVTGLNPSTTYYFAIKTADEVANWSIISNSPGGTTSSVTEQLYENVTNDNNGGNIGGTYWLAQTFTPAASHTVTMIKLKLARSTATPSGNINVSIRNTGINGIPTGEDLAAAAVLFSGLSDEDYAVYTFSLNQGVSVTQGQTYAIIFNAPSMTVDDLFYRYQTNSGLTIGRSFSSDSGGYWNPVDAGDCAYFEEWGIP